MELVYLWVEDYKNIQNQGFNFSSHHNCNYDTDTKKLTINKNESNHGFFGKNINITAIVGGNGSGKSSLIKIFFLLIYFNKYSLSNNDYIKLIKQKYKKTFFAVIVNNDGTYEKLTYNVDISCNEDCSEVNNVNFYSLYFNYITDTWCDDYEDYWVNQLYHKTDNYSTPLLLQPNKQDSNTLSNIIDIDMISYLNSQRLLQFYSKVENNQSISNFFDPSYIKLLTSTKSISYSSKGEAVEFNKIGKIGNKLLKTAHKYSFKLDFGSQNKILKELKSIEDSGDFEYINQLYITLKVLLSDTSLYDAKMYERVKKSFEESIKKDILIPKTELVQVKEFDKLINKTTSEYKSMKLIQCFGFQMSAMYESKEFKELFEGENLDLGNAQVKSLLKYIPPWVDIDFFEDTKSLTTLSSGEKALLTIILNIMYHCQNISEEEYKTINIFLDETELGLHPNWQKRYLNDILESLKLLNIKDKKINICMATHSPFILSDLPKENVLFLEEGKQKDVGISTFGANIHTLLSDGFFMDQGLMGEFAKSKINVIIQQLNTKDYGPTEEEKLNMLQIIKCIGEPFLKRKLLDMYYKKFNDDYLKIVRKKELLLEQSRIEEELKSYD